MRVSVWLVVWMLGLSASLASGQSTASGIVALVDGEAVARDEVWRRWQAESPAEYARLQRELYDAERRALDAIIGERLLAAEARAQGLTPETLLSTRVLASVSDVGQPEIDALLATSQPPAGVGRAALEQVARTLLQERAREAATRRFLSSLRGARGRVEIRLQAPRAAVPRAAHSAARGSATARVEMVVFSDFECPFCRRIAPVVQRLSAQYPDEVRLVWRHFPLAVHAHAAAAAEAAQCAHDQQRFWDFHDALFSDTALVTGGAFDALARRLGLDMPSFTRCLEEHRHADAVAVDVAEGQRLGVSGTPTVFINGVAYVGALDYGDYQRAVDDELARIGSVTSGAPVQEERR